MHLTAATKTNDAQPGPFSFFHHFLSRLTQASPPGFGRLLCVAVIGVLGRVSDCRDRVEVAKPVHKRRAGTSCSDIKGKHYVTVIHRFFPTVER
jgi:hypothetical protein